MKRTLPTVALLLLLALVQGAAVMRKGGKECLWLSAIDSILDFERSQPEISSPAAVCMLRGGRSTIITEYGCHEMLDTTRVEEVQCAKCVTYDAVLRVVTSCKKLNHIP